MSKKKAFQYRFISQSERLIESYKLKKKERLFRVVFIQPETAEKTNKKTIYSSNLITLTGQLSAASLIPASKSAKTTPCFTSEISITSNTSGHILSQLPHEMQSSSTQTLLIDIVLVINIISMISINPKTSNYCELFALL